MTDFIITNGCINYRDHNFGEDVYLTIDNKYVPFYIKKECLYKTSPYLFNILDGNYIFEFKRIEFGKENKIYQNHDLIESLQLSMGLVKYNYLFDYSHEDINYGDNDYIDDIVYVGKGFLLDNEKKILMILCTDSNTLLEDVEFYNNHKLLVSTEFLSNPEYSSFVAKIFKCYINVIVEKGVKVEVMTSQDIENTCYNKFSYDYNFQTINDYENKCEEIKKIVTFNLFDYISGVQELNLNKTEEDGFIIIDDLINELENSYIDLPF